MAVGQRPAVVDPVEGGVGLEDVHAELLGKLHAPQKKHVPGGDAHARLVVDGLPLPRQFLFHRQVHVEFHPRQQAADRGKLGKRFGGDAVHGVAPLVAVGHQLVAVKCTGGNAR